MDPFGIIKQNDHLEEYFRGRRNGRNKVELGMYLACEEDGEEMNLASKGGPCW